MRSFLISVALATVALAMPSAASAATCPTFQVMHNDRIGSVKLSAGQYTPATAGVTCANAGKLLTRFLSDWDGILPGGWTVTQAGAGATFVNGVQSIALAPGKVKPNSNTTQNGVCPGTFTVLHNDHIGRLKLPAGEYQITTKRLHCWFDIQKLQLFLASYESGNLPRPWKVIPAQKKIQRSTNSWFTLKRVGRKPIGGTSTPNSSSCSTNFLVVNSTQIDGTPVAAGRYTIVTLGSYSCRTASTMFKQFLAAGKTPLEWTFVPETGLFLIDGQGFRVDPQ